MWSRARKGADVPGRGMAGHQEGVSMGSRMPASPEPTLGYPGGEGTCHRDMGLHPPQGRDHFILTATRHQRDCRGPKPHTRRVKQTVAKSTTSS